MGVCVPAKYLQVGPRAGVCQATSSWLIPPGTLPTLPILQSSQSTLLQEAFLAALSTGPSPPCPTAEARLGSWSEVSTPGRGLAPSPSVTLRLSFCL